MLALDESVLNGRTFRATKTILLRSNLFINHFGCVHIHTLAHCTRIVNNRTSVLSMSLLEQFIKTFQQ